MRLSNRIESLPPYLFAQISKIIAKKKEEGVDVISLGIGDPDLPTPQRIINKLVDAANIPANHRYPESEGLPEFRQAVASYYKSRHNVELNFEDELITKIYNLSAGDEDEISSRIYRYFNLTTSINLLKPNLNKITEIYSIKP